ncbi:MULTISPECIES: helix-turn-helix domain-containing protein [Cyanophyceae]|uniref:helix-turn-helix domain-containing protein n=1 Tax=Cyanophyceae TaxID=3028117 RepID=UPI00168A3AC5|nr:helix-turn-helix domain-containing protein [Trichocoleus sp. FACHB-40]MBD2006186.1 helix-turn-helix domain-containing protein [Trichocoleus sp. FACHB-40]
MDTEENRSNRMIFVHAYLDLYGLSPYEFRLYAHIARRGKCFSNLNTTAKICKMSVRKAQYALKTLESCGLVEKTTRKGKTDIYELTSRSKWKEPEYDEELKAEREKVTVSLLKLKGSTDSTADSGGSKHKEKI